MFKFPSCLIISLTMIALPAHSHKTGYRIYDVKTRAESEDQLALGTLSTLIHVSLKSTMPFPWDLLESVNSGDTLPIMEVVKFELPVLIPAALGILISILVVIVTPCYFCCRCCGCCGGRLTMSDIRKQNRHCMYVTGGFVVFAIVFICLTAFSSWESGVMLRKSPRMVLDMVDSSLDDLPAFITNFGNEMSLLVETEINETLKTMQARVGDLPNILSAPLTDIAGSVMTGVDSNIQTLLEGMNNITNIESETNTTVQNIQLLSNSLRQGINNINSNLTQMIMQCVVDGETFCHLLLDRSTNTAEFNVSELSDLSSAVTDLVSELKSVNLTEIQSLGNESLTSLPETIDNSSRTAVSGVLEEIDKIPGKILPELDSLLEFTNMSRESLGMNSSLDSFKNWVDTYDALTSPLVDKIVLPIVSSYMGIIVILALLGVLFGVLCSRRGYVFASRSTASQAGSTCLICTVVLSMFLVMIFMLLGSLLLLVGGNVSVVCNPIQDLTLIEKLENGYLDLYSDDMLKDLLNRTISLKHFFETCRNKGTVYSGLNLGDNFNLSSFINISSFVPELGSDVYDKINETIRDMNVLDTELLDNLTSSFSFTNITDDNSTQSIKEELLDLDLREWSANLTNVVPLLPKQVYADTYSKLAQTLIDLDVNEKGPLLTAVDGIDNITLKIEAIAEKLENSSLSISNELEKLQQFIQNQATETIFQTVDKFLDDMAMVPVDFIDALTLKMSNSIGECGVLWDIYEVITSSVCNWLLDSLTSFWLSLYIGGLAMVVLMISSCTIQKYFRKPSDIRMYQNMSMNARPPAVIADISNNSINDNRRETPLPDWCYRVVKQKQRKRRKRFYTGDQSPQLIKIRMLGESLKDTGACRTETTDVCKEHNTPNDSITIDTDIANSDDCHVSTPNQNVLSNDTDVVLTLGGFDTECSNPKFNYFEGDSIGVDDPDDIAITDKSQSTAEVLKFSTFKPNYDDVNKSAQERPSNDGMSSMALKESDVQHTSRNENDGDIFRRNRKVVQRPTTLAICPVRPHPRYVTDEVTGNIIQCALCKHRNTEIKLGNMEDNTVPQTRGPSKLSPLSQTQLSYNEQSNNTDNRYQNQSSWDANQSNIWLSTDNTEEGDEDVCESNDTPIADVIRVTDHYYSPAMSQETTTNTQFDLSKEVCNNMVQSGNDMMDSKGESLDKVFNEFNAVYGSFAEAPLEETGHYCTFEENESFDTRTCTKAGVDKIEYKTGSNSKTILDIQVKPYKEFYRNKDNWLITETNKCHENIDTHDSLPHVNEHSITDSGQGIGANGDGITLSILAARAVSQLPLRRDTAGPVKHPALMTAYCGHGHIKTTYL